MAYHEFAYFYDAFNGAADYDALYRYVTDRLESHQVKPGIVVDLGCGTGELTLMLVQAGYDVIGVDQSEEMLAVLRDKAEQLNLLDQLLLLRQDILKLDLYGSVRGVVSTFDTYNHIQDLDAAIKMASYYMEKGGVFIFDLNTPYKHREILGENTFDIEDEDAICHWQNHYREDLSGVEISIEIRYSGEEETISERFMEYTHPIERVKAVLQKYGFELEDLRDGETFAPLREDSQRYLITAVKQYDQLEGFEHE